MKTNIFLILLLITILGCSNKKNVSDNSADTIVISMEEKVQDIEELDSTMFYNLEYTVLETNDKCFIGRINKLIVYNDKFYILDKFQAKKVFVFSKDGKFINTVGSLGQGPEEYQQIEDFTINESNGDILILSSLSNVFIYNNGGEYIEQKSLSDNATFLNVSSYKNGYIFKNANPNNEEYLIFNYNKNLKFLNKSIKKSLFKVNFTPFFNPLLKYGDNISCFNIFTNNLILKVDSLVSKKIIFDFNGKEMPAEAYWDSQIFYKKQFTCSYFLDAIITNNILLSAFVYEGKRHFAVMNMDNNKVKIFEESKWFPKKILFSKDNFIYSYLEPSEFMDNDYIPKFTKETNNYKLESDSNPVILKYKLKTFIIDKIK